MAAVDIVLSGSLSVTDPERNPVLIVGKLSNLRKVDYSKVQCKFNDKVSEETYKFALQHLLNPNPVESRSLWLDLVTIAAFSDSYSRHNAPAKPHLLTRTIKVNKSGYDDHIVLITERSELFASICAIARAYPTYNRRSSQSNKRKKTIQVEVILVCDEDVDDTLSEEDIVCLDDMIVGVRLAAKIVDMPCSEMDTDAFISEIRSVGAALDIEPVIIRGEELNDRGFQGIYNVGKAAEKPPALVYLSHTPDSATKSIAWVGKGIVYDTGGLCIKGRTQMTGMKRDCGGAAAILGAFYATVKQGFSDALHAVFCLAENAVGSKAVRPDDIITLYSGKTVEINNTDAEGRLVLADGVAFAKKDLKAEVIVDMATLTGAQGVATGRYHGALLTNSECWEEACVRAGRRSGDLVHPVVYCPELNFTDFASSLADMKNSTSDKANAEVSAAGFFIGSQLNLDWPGVWMHIDMAYTVFSNERATGYGVALLTALFGASPCGAASLRALAADADVANGTASSLSPSPSPSSSDPKKQKVG